MQSIIRNSLHIHYAGYGTLDSGNSKSIYVVFLTLYVLCLWKNYEVFCPYNA